LFSSGNSLYLPFKYTKLPEIFQESNNKYSIVLGNIIDSRTKRIFGNERNYFGVLRNGYGIPIVACYSTIEQSIDTLITDLLKDALKINGYNLIFDDRNKKNPIMDIEVIDFFMDGYMGMNLKIELNIKMYSSDRSKMLFKKNFKYNYTYLLDDHASIKIALCQFLNTIYFNLINLFKLSFFEQAVKGQVINFLPEIVKINKDITSIDEIKSDKDPIIE
jgi:hypothetical protein